VKAAHRELSGRCDSLIPQLEALITKMEILLAEEVKMRRQEREAAKKKKRLAGGTRD
jgi:hypothetical protein